VKDGELDIKWKNCVFPTFTGTLGSTNTEIHHEDQLDGLPDLHTGCQGVANWKPVWWAGISGSLAGFVGKKKISLPARKF